MMLDGPASARVNALGLDSCGRGPLTKAERRAQERGDTGKPTVDEILGEVKLLHTRRSVKNTSIEGKLLRVLPQSRDAAGMVCSSKRTSRRSAANRDGLRDELVRKLASRLLRRHEYIQQRCFSYWQLVCGRPESPVHGDDFRIIEDDEGVPLCSVQT